MPRVGELRAPRIVNHTVDFYGVGVRFVYDANKLRDSWLAEWTALEETTQSAKMNDMLDDLVISWDITNDDGSRFEKTPQAFEEIFNIPDKTFILQELLMAVRPSSEEGNALSPSTESTEPPAEPSRPDSPNSPNGSETMPLPTVSASQSTS